MSRKSENSAGDGASQESSPRQSIIDVAGPHGDINNESILIYKFNENFLSDEEDNETTQLKMEYLYRLKVIKEKLASMDISNKSYYFTQENQCKITEIHQRESESFKFRKTLDTGEEFTDQLDLNYNPPKKRPCLRVNTPRLALSEGAMPLPYHIRISLHDEICNANRRALDNVAKIENVQKLDTPIKEDQDMYLLFLDVYENSSTSSPKSTVTTVESCSSRKPKKRFFFKSANNKVKPVDSYSLWEEIRTMEAVQQKPQSFNQFNRIKPQSFNRIFGKVPFDSSNQEWMSLDSLESPRKSDVKTSRFPRITTFFTRKSKQKDETEEEDVKNVASSLLMLNRQLNLDLDNDTPSIEKSSEIEYQKEQDDIDDHQRFCLFCFCC